MTAGPGTWIHKPMGEWHTFWNAGDTPCEIIEVTSPPGFENYFRELAAARRSPEAVATLNERYGLDMDFDSVPGQCQRYGLTFPQV